MIFFFNPTDAIASVFAILDADNTLKGSTCLGASNRIFSNRAPNNAACPFLVITLDQFTPDEMQHYQGELRVFCYDGLLANGQINSHGNLILSRCEELLNNVSPSITGAQVQPLICLGVVPSFIDPSDSSRQRGLLRFRFEAGKNG